jgi:hypothetical protein
MSNELHTLEDTLETARQAQRPVRLALAGRIDEAREAYVVARNGATFEFMIGGTRVVMDLSQVVLVLSVPKHKSQPPPPT